MAKKSPKVGQEELAVLRFIQETHPVTVREVADHFASRGKARTTILTVMERLRGKGLLVREKVSSSYRYSPAIEDVQLMQSLVGDFVTKVLGGSLAPFMAYMSETSELSDDELKKLKRIVRDLETKRKKSGGKK